MSGASIQGILAFAVVLGTGIAWFRRFRAVAVPEDRILFVAAMAAGAILGAIALAGDPGWLGGTLALLAVLGGALFGFTVAISAQKGGPGAFRVGQPAPVFGAPDEDGALVSTADFADRPLLLKFFRGHW